MDVESDKAKRSLCSMCSFFFVKTFSEIVLKSSSCYVCFPFLTGICVACFF